MVKQPAYAAETAILRRVATNPGCRWIWTNHVLKQMKDRRITQPDVKRVLTRGQVLFHEWAKKDVLLRVEGRDVDGNRLQVQVAVYEEAIEIKVITTF
jgi:hypothetical protein